MRKKCISLWLNVLLTILLMGMGSAYAESYYQTGASPAAAVVVVESGATSRTIIFNGTANQIATSSNANDLSLLYEYVSSTTYTTSSYADGVYYLVPHTDTITIKNGGGDTYLTMTATALTYKSDGTITWQVNDLDVINTAGLQTLIDLDAVGTTYTYTMATTGGLSYTAKLTGEGVAAVPEPAEWMLMFIGLGMLGFYLQRSGYLNFDLSPQSVA